MSEKTGRILTSEEIEWLNCRALINGFDLDSCEPQLNHVVMTLHPIPSSDSYEALCKADTIWFQVGWGGTRADGSIVQEDYRLSCTSCLAKFDNLYKRSCDRSNFSGWSASQAFRRHVENIDSLKTFSKDIGRPDVAMLLESVVEALGSEKMLDETTLRFLLAEVLSLKSKKIAAAMELLRQSDNP